MTERAIVVLFVPVYSQEQGGNIGRGLTEIKPSPNAQRCKTKSSVPAMKKKKRTGRLRGERTYLCIDRRSHELRSVCKV